MIKKVIKHPLFSGSFIMIFGSLFVNGVNYVYHLVMGRVLGPSDYGVLASLFSILYIISIVPQSSGIAVAKFISSAKNKKQRSAVYWGVKKIIWIIAAILSIILIVISLPISHFLHIDDLLSVLLIGPILFLSLITLVNQASSQGLLKFMGIVGPNFVSAVGKLLIGLLLVFLGFSIVGAVLGVLLAVFLAYFLSKNIVSNYFVKTRIDFNLKQFARYSMPVLIQALAFTSFFTMDVILIKHFLSPFDAGLYAALSMLGKIIYFAAQPVTSVMFPIVSGKRSRGEYYKNIFIVAFFATFSIATVISLFYYIFPRIAIGVMYGEEYLQISGELVWMALFITVYTLSYLIVNFLLSIGKTQIVGLPMLASIAQVIGILLWHNSILQVIQVSLFCVLILFIGLSGYMGYYQLRKIYVETRER